MAGLPQRLRGTVRGGLHRDAERADRALRERSRRRAGGLIEAARADLEHVRARVRALSPQATLERGYAVVRTEATAPSCARRPTPIGTLRVRVAGGEFGAVATS